MAAARTIPDTQKRRTCIALIMSYKIVVTETLRWHRRTAEAKRGASSAEPVRMFALRVASIHLRRAHMGCQVNLINSPPSAGEDQFVPYCCSDCLPTSTLEWKILALASGRLSQR